ncbi:hypothetical protein Q5P01_018688 [Channa striata]|uniref:Death domain-associated protein 6 n=1 Tax=Channa striata TaxID=64152 RepID=A0AA88M8A0_CHASR|nr:hypothetical protein Q5P01_018688 [Channa striata]
MGNEITGCAHTAWQPIRGCDALWTLAGSLWSLSGHTAVQHINKGFVCKQPSFSMAVAPASLADKIIVLDDEEEETPQNACAASNPSSERPAKNNSPSNVQQLEPTHTTQSPAASAKRGTDIVQAENERLFTEFVEHCKPYTQDCPEVLTYLQTKRTKATPDYLSSVEFRNTLGRCLTRAQANRSKTFVYIHELCVVLRQHAVKKRQNLTKVESSTSASSTFQSTSVVSKNKDEAKLDGVEEEQVRPGAENEQPSTSGVQENNNEQEAERKSKRASRKQIAYLENLLKVYNDEIWRLQQAELSLDDLEAEDSLYIQEHKLKRKIMKIYEKLCELKGCNKLTGRVMEQRICYNSTRYPEINKRITRFINSPEAQMYPPDYQDILQQVLRANERHKLCLSRKQVIQIAKDAFRETGGSMQDRRHKDLLYNFGSHVTDNCRHDLDPAQSDPSLEKKLQSNREVALSRLEEVITKYAKKQDDLEEQERSKRLEKNSKEKEDNKSEKGEETKKVNGAAEEEKEEEAEEEEEEEEEEEDDDNEEDESSDPDIEEEIRASTQQNGPDDDEENEEDDTNEAEQAEDDANKEDQTDGLSGSFSAGDEGSAKDDEEPVTSGLSPFSDGSKSQMSLLSDVPSSKGSPSRPEHMQADYQQPLSNGDAAGSEEPVDSSTHDSAVNNEPADASPAVANGASLPLSTTAVAEAMNGTSPPPSPRTTRSQKRKREEITTQNSIKPKRRNIHDSSEVDIPLDMGVYSCNSPEQAESIRADTPNQELVSSSQSTPPPKKNKVNVATQCDPDEIIVLSDSE